MKHSHIFSPKLLPSKCTFLAENFPSKSAYLAHFVSEPFPAKKFSRQNTHSYDFLLKCSFLQHVVGKIRKMHIASIFPRKCFPRQNLRAINISAGNEHFNRRKLLWAFWPEWFVAGIAFRGKCSRYSLLAGYCWRQMWISVVTYYGRKIQAICIFRIFWK